MPWVDLLLLNMMVISYDANVYSDCLVRNLRICAFSFNDYLKKWEISVEIRKVLLCLQNTQKNPMYKGSALLWMEFYNEDYLETKIGCIIKHVEPFIELTIVSVGEDIIDKENNTKLVIF